jgi:hypothetical protein
MRCSVCDNPLNEWEGVCDSCGHEPMHYCRCHDEEVRYVKGSCMGSRDKVCTVTGKYCETYFK